MTQQDVSVSDHEMIWKMGFLDIKVIVQEGEEKKYSMNSISIQWKMEDRSKMGRLL